MSKPWYIDRSRNFEGSKNEITYLIFLIKELEKIDKQEFLASAYIIDHFPEKWLGTANKNALLTFCRDVGVINNENRLGKNAERYSDYEMTYKEYIFELIMKRAYNKPNSYDVKPIPIIFLAIKALYSKKGIEECYLTFDEIGTFLFSITNSYDEINSQIDLILVERNQGKNNSSSNTRSVLDIYFNALKYIGLFEGEEKNIIRVKSDALDLILDLAENIDRMSIAPKVKKINAKEREVIYNYLGNDKNGIIELLPIISIKNKKFTCENFQYFEHIFGIKEYEEVKKEIDLEFGVFSKYSLIKGLLIRKIGFANKEMGDILLKYYSKHIEDAKIEKTIIETKVEISSAINENKNEEEKELYINVMYALRNPGIQRKFRKKLLEEFQGECAICKLNFESLLVSSHIVPYAKCERPSDAEDQNNGLLLCAKHDALFDKGLISFDQDGRVKLSSKIKKIMEFGWINEEFVLDMKYLTESRKKFLEFHEENIFKQENI